MTKVKPGSVLVGPLLITAQLLALAVFALALYFLLDTNGLSLSLFAMLAPALVGLAIALLVGVVIYRYNTSHHLFDIETYAPGEVIFLEGDPGACAYFIHSGEVEIVREEHGQEKVIAKLGKDKYFGEMALIKNAPRNATVRALVETRVAALGKKNFLTLLSVMPVIKEDILKTVHDRAMTAGQ